MEFFRLTMDTRSFFANSLKSSSFYKSEGKVEFDKLEQVI